MELKKELDMHNLTVMISSLWFIFLSHASMGVFIEHETFKVKKLSSFSTAIVSSVTSEEGCGIYTESGIGISVNKSQDAVYEIVFLIAVQEHAGVVSTLQSRATISYQIVPNATFKWRLNKTTEDKLAKILSATAGVFQVENEIEIDVKKNIIIRSFKRVKCKVVSKKEVLKLIEVYFSGFDMEEKLWVDILT